MLHPDKAELKHLMSTEFLESLPLSVAYQPSALKSHLKHINGKCLEPPTISIFFLKWFATSYLFSYLLCHGSHRFQNLWPKEHHREKYSCQQELPSHLQSQQSLCEASGSPSRSECIKSLSYLNNLEPLQRNMQV